jgi:hypothetical protein
VTLLTNSLSSEMHKRRSSLIAAIIDELNENIYIGTLKQLTFELGEISVEIWDLLNRKCNTPNEQKPSVKRMNTGYVTII